MLLDEVLAPYDETQCDAKVVLLGCVTDEDQMLDINEGTQMHHEERFVRQLPPLDQGEAN